MNRLPNRHAAGIHVKPFVLRACPRRKIMDLFLRRFSTLPYILVSPWKLPKGLHNKLRCSRLWE